MLLGADGFYVREDSSLNFSLEGLKRFVVLLCTTLILGGIIVSFPVPLENVSILQEHKQRRSELTHLKDPI
jgi:hypothetical protein